ncbi:MAG: AMP-binding protein [Bacteroidales bacterium]|nr:AMP-binding protein [Bacteroidales bacterium]MCF8387540.1 AMP-binding protein [Bacteroidales bacterium]MCF8397920.1 AMP-binding protein [Bacteroidales bacterium]
MRKLTQLTFPEIFSETCKRYKDRNAFSFVGEQPRTYADVDDRIRSLVTFLEKLGIKPGDKVAILGTNMPNWPIGYLAVSFIGAVVVPILPDFSEEEIGNILQHSEAKTIFVSEKLQETLNRIYAPGILHTIKLEDFSLTSATEKDIQYKAEDLTTRKFSVREDDLASIVYTSGTTGRSKGVMLSHKNIVSNAIAGGYVQQIDENDRFLSILPLSHTYENTIGMILPILCGASVYYMKEKPVPANLIKAMQQVKPTMMLTVPLIIEKVFRNRVKPALTANLFLKILYRISFLRKKMHRRAGVQLMESFGGKLKFFGIGGAKLDREVEKFLIEAKFPYAIGYGLTETSPLLAGVNPHHVRLQSTGPAIQGIELRIKDPDEKTGIGEIWAKGPNVMQGYYKNEEESKKILSGDGWLKTGDLGVFDRDNFLYLKGRVKNVIVGANGENVYPEEIESLINNFRHVAESIVLNKKGKLVALVHLNMEELEKRYQYLQDELHHQLEKKKQDLINELMEYVNARVTKFARLKMIVLHAEPFQKTPTQKIKRFLYS